MLGRLIVHDKRQRWFSPADPGSDYHLTLNAGSPCIDTALDLPFWYPWITGYVNHDLDQQSRPVGAGYDMGCYERQ